MGRLVLKVGTNGIRCDPLTTHIKVLVFTLWKCVSYSWTNKKLWFHLNLNTLSFVNGMIFSNEVFIICCEIAWNSPFNFVLILCFLLFNMTNHDCHTLGLLLNIPCAFHLIWSHTSNKIHICTHISWLVISHLQWLGDKTHQGLTHWKSWT